MSLALPARPVREWQLHSDSQACECSEAREEVRYQRSNRPDECVAQLRSQALLQEHARMSLPFSPTKGPNLALRFFCGEGVRCLGARRPANWSQKIYRTVWP